MVNHLPPDSLPLRILIPTSNSQTGSWTSLQTHPLCKAITLVLKASTHQNRQPSVSTDVLAVYDQLQDQCESLEDKIKLFHHTHMDLLKSSILHASLQISAGVLSLATRNSPHLEANYSVWLRLHTALCVCIATRSYLESK